MKIIHTIKEIREEVKAARRSGKSIGFVPTMGFLHEGHLSLIKKAREENDFVVVSIFVNPTQFGPEEDLESYPRDLERDSRLSEEAGADVIFNPTAEEMYPEGYSTYVEIEGELTKKLCGISRPGHFKGVTTVVSKLFNIVTPDRAYFGQKDAQQVAVIEQMVRDLNFDVKIVPCPIVREKDGLAMSSRNTYLSKEERKAALILSKTLFKAEEMIKNGERNSTKIRDFIINNIKSEPLANIDYVEIVDAKSLKYLNEIKGDVLIALAVKFGRARLLDNIRLEVK
ncbi:pantoate--beta-alanine ligase [Caminicella sporogenes DSM 14501]|uniref:Pantothenate synthetase n=1 Tax=Caminicella sporogenes DSM 14501 TaxID=1121266 RepID=A0A1M6P0F5_9FIRM|nr:pantoate--beta-alanine ligase [Caminicella sporogenes]RKD21577.1 pantoate--beta-alanine ligase [Caminicella sporogenes]SHK01398.1 pantoate--beta-alanine ligase [Caminicella sporogenes DSM 14501]